MSIGGRVRREVRRQAPDLDRAFSLGVVAFLVILAVAVTAAVSDPSASCRYDDTGMAPLAPAAARSECGRRP